DAVVNGRLKGCSSFKPFKSGLGWHVVQIMYTQSDQAEMTELKNKIAGGADFATIARDFSDGNEAGKGGDKGWVAQGLIDARLLRAINAAPVGGLSDVVDIKNGGEFL